MSAPSRLEWVLTDPAAFGLTTASPLQRAICRCLDGVPLDDLATDPAVLEAFGGAAAVASLPTEMPAELVLLAGIRSGKSLLAAACAVRAALTCDVSRLGPGEVPRVSVLSLSVDTARATWAHVRGRVDASPTLRALLLEEPTADTLLIRHPSGRPVEIKVVAGSRAAGSLVARWSAGVIFDEAPRMVGSEDGVVNLDDARHSVLGRLLEGAQALLIGSTWAPFGPVYDLVQEHAGRPSRDIVIVRATGPQMNPEHWTPERCEQLRVKDPDAYRVDVNCEFLDPETGLFSSTELEDCKREEPADLPPCERHYYVAAMDPATRGNAWTLVVAAKTETPEGTPKIAIALAREWIGSRSAPLSPRAIFAEIAALLRPYRCKVIATDQWAADALRDTAIGCGLYVRPETTTANRRLELYDMLQRLVADRAIEFPPNATLLRDLASVRRRITQQGVSIELPRTSSGRHADYAPAVALVVSQSMSNPVPVPKPETEEERQQRETTERKKEASERIAKRQAREWRSDSYGMFMRLTK